MISNPLILIGKCSLFEGSSQYDRFHNIFLEIISDKEHRASFVALGMPPEHFRTHSIRKGAVTHIATGTTSSPPIASICLRANWAMPGVLNRYIAFENAGDQFVGKCVSGRSRLKKEFAASCPYFYFDCCNEAERKRKSKEVNIWIKNRTQEDTRSNENVFYLFKRCIASLEHNRSFMEKHLHSKSNI